MIKKIVNIAPKDIQERLSWGILNYDSKTIEDAIDAGANPFICHTTKLAKPYLIQNRIEMHLDAKELSPYYLLFYTPKRAMLDDEKSRRQAILNTAETLLKLNVSVDKKTDRSDVSFRQQLKLWINEFVDEAKNQSLSIEQKNVINDMRNTVQDLLALIEKYQPEQKSLNA